MRWTQPSFGRIGPGIRPRNWVILLALRNPIAGSWYKLHGSVSTFSMPGLAESVAPNLCGCRSEAASVAFHGCGSEAALACLAACWSVRRSVTMRVVRISCHSDMRRCVGPLGGGHRPDVASKLLPFTRCTHRSHRILCMLSTRRHRWPTSAHAGPGPLGYVAQCPARSRSAQHRYPAPSMHDIAAKTLTCGVGPGARRTSYINRPPDAGRNKIMHARL